MDQHAQFWHTWNWKLWIEGSAHELWQSILQGLAVAMSNGLFQDAAEAAAWTIKGNTAMHQLWGKGHTPANKNDHSSYCSELFGLWGILFTLLWLTKDHNIIEGKTTLACNGLLALHKAQGQQMTEPNKVHYDIISAIWELQNCLPIQVIFKHVKGHQDNGQIMALPQLAWMNIEMDSCAKQKVSLEGTKTLKDDIPYEGWTCSIKGKRIVKHFDNGT